MHNRFVLLHISAGVKLTCLGGSTAKSIYMHTVSKWYLDTTNNLTLAHKKTSHADNWLYTEMKAESTESHNSKKELELDHQFPPALDTML